MVTKINSRNLKNGHKVLPTISKVMVKIYFILRGKGFGFTNLVYLLSPQFNWGANILPLLLIGLQSDDIIIPVWHW